MVFDFQKQYITSGWVIQAAPFSNLTTRYLVSEIYGILVGGH